MRFKSECSITILLHREALMSKCLVICHMFCPMGWFPGVTRYKDAYLCHLRSIFNLYILTHMSCLPPVSTDTFCLFTAMSPLGNNAGMYCCYRADFSLIEGFGESAIHSSFQERYQYKDNIAAGTLNDTLEQLYLGKSLSKIRGCHCCVISILKYYYASPCHFGPLLATLLNLMYVYIQTIRLWNL